MSKRVLIEDNGAVFDLERGPKVLFGANVNRFREINELRKMRGLSGVYAGSKGY